MIQILLYIAIILLALRVFTKAQQWREHDRLLSLCTEAEVKEEINWEIEKNSLDIFTDRFGSAGYYDEKSRNIFKAVAAISFILLAIVLAWKLNLFIAVLASLYLNTMFFLFFLKFKRKDIERETLFRLPIFLESVILLVEAGLGVLPAVQKVVNNSKNKKEPVSRIMNTVYELSSSGMPFGQALELVANKIESKPLRHVLMHLDVSSSEGGALIPSLRSLADYASKEWKLSVETRVKRLENSVVFPVFFAVIGLMLLVAAAPIDPVIEFFGSMDNKAVRNATTKVGGGI